MKIKMKMKLLLMTLTSITILVSASIDDDDPYYELLSFLPFSSIQGTLSLAEQKLKLDESIVKVLPYRYQYLEEEMDELGRNETRLLSRYHEVHDLKKKRLNICKLHHMPEILNLKPNKEQQDGNDEDDEYAANQTLLLVQVYERKKLLSTLSALSQVNTKILELMKIKLEVDEFLMQVKQDIPKHHQEIMQLKCMLHFLQSMSPSELDSFYKKLFEEKSPREAVYRRACVQNDDDDICGFCRR